MEEIHKAIQLMEQNKPEDAINLLQSFLPRANEEEKFTIAELYMRWGMLNEAKHILIDFLQSYPNEEEIKIMLAEIYIDLEEDEAAIDLLNQFTPLDEGYVEALIQLADLYQAQGLFEVSEQKLLEAKNINPHEPLIDFALGELAFSVGEYQKAIPYYEKVWNVQPVIADIEIGLRLAEAYAATGDFENALDYYQSTENDNPDHLFRYGFIAFRGDRLDISIKVWEQLLETDPHFQSVYYYLAKAYDEEGMIEEGYETAKKGLRIDEFNKELFFLTGVLAHRLGKREEGLQFVRESVSIDPGYKEAVLFLIENYKNIEDNQAVIDLLTHVQELGEEEGYYKWELAKAHREIESFNDALNMYMDAYNDFKDDSDFLKEYGYFLVEEGRIKEATKVLTEYLKIEPVDIEVEEYLGRLKENELF
ncbi:tetratricopeptide repeat protein [Aquibacillus salsiterrae]|uniref:Tetratricopeptide repeat protein n=1 Tax=Aquibacillus salsiterrae TaxID=2950439 RepID=A0A9X3WDD6_9BACI|nr:tetratricopeptide repeat protein [Aquibacillus salsiterrae]MDC3415369.1 tetratricopeptide repeat protein [Aquibacillus salsiterrae]